MFKCERCNCTTAPKERMTKVVVATRFKQYYDRYGNVIGEGHEIVAEQKICQKCSEEA